MKKLLYIFCSSILLISCGSDDGGGTPPPAENKAPSVPVQSAPINNLLCIDNTVTFEWSASTDPEGDSVTYELQVATDNAFTQNLETRTAISTSSTVSLVKGVAYYWRVKAIDAKNASSDYSSTFNFYTEGEGERNHLPFLPELIGPSINEVVQNSTVELRWSASDVDVNDVLTFDVYLDEVNPPVNLVSQNQSANSFSANINSSTTYYWKVVVKDDKGGSALGQIWNFKTD